jgi:hypothetical protein
VASEPLLVVQILGLIKEEVGGQLLVLVTREISLNHEVALEAKATQTLDSLTLLLCNGNGLCTWGQRRIVVSILGKQLQELLRVGCDHLRQLGVALTDLLQNRFKHLGLLLYDLSQLLELWVVAQEVEAVGVERTSTSISACGASRACTTSTSATLPGLRSCLEQVYRLVSSRSGWGCTCVTAGSGRWRGRCASL